MYQNKFISRTAYKPSAIINKAGGQVPVVASTPIPQENNSALSNDLLSSAASALSGMKDSISGLFSDDKNINNVASENAVNDVANSLFNQTGITQKSGDIGGNVINNVSSDLFNPINGMAQNIVSSGLNKTAYSQNPSVNELDLMRLRPQVGSFMGRFR